MEDHDQRGVRARLGKDPSAVPAARHRLEPLRSAMSDESFDDLRLLVSELVTNSVRHTEAGGEVELTVAVEGDHVRATVLDDGPGFSPRPRTEGQDPGSGWGLHFLRLLAVEWGVDRTADERTATWFALPRAVRAGRGA